MTPQIHIAIAEDHDIVREGLVALFRGHPIIKVAFSAGNGKELYDTLKTVRPDVILLDLEMPVMSGREVFDKIKSRYPKIKIIIISATFYDATILEFMKKGAGSFLYKNCRFDKLVEAIKTVEEQGVYFDENISKILARDLREPQDFPEQIEFSELEISILKLIREGLTSKEIGDKLCINNRTVEWHRSQMIRRTGTKNAPDLIAYAIKGDYL